LSLVIVLGQLTIFCDSWSLSLLALFFKREHDFGLTLAFSIVLLGYMAGTAYWSVLRLKIAGYGIYTDHDTDGGSLLRCASMFTRLAAPLCYHFLLLIRVDGTAFQAFMGQMNVVPVLGRSFNRFFPCLVVVLALCNVLNLFSRFCFNLDAFEIERMALDSVDFAADGKECVARERRRRSAAQRVNVCQKVRLESGENNSASPLCQQTDAVDVKPFDGT